MEEGKPRSEYQGIAAQFAAAKARQEQEEAQGLRNRSGDAKAADKRRELQFKSSHSLLVAFLALMSVLHILGLYLFTTGFLLTRLVLDHKSDCAVPPVDLYGTSHTPGTIEKGCWHPKSFEKAVVIIVDALRYDFTVPFLPREDDTKPHHFHNAIPFLYETASKQPNNAVLLPFIADPPTTTLQRLKGLTTGTLPTFIDAGSNFAGTAIDEDNLIAQLRNASKNVVHLGDDTWHSLFPGLFDAELTRPYDSFNVWDLHTVDNGVSEHLFPYLAPANSSKWDVLIGHYLGVDHAGHRYGPDHPAMTDKLQQMDGVFRRVVDTLDDDTLLVVMGDHGMDSKGDHGGESDDEVQAALWMYSKRGIFGRSHADFVQPPATAKERPVNQIDLVPTLALLLGLPIPFNNLGKPIEEAFVGPRGDDHRNLALVNRLAAAQIHRYQHEYALAKGLAEQEVSPLGLWDMAQRTWDALVKTSKPTQEQWKQAYERYSSYQKLTLSVCKSLWAEFHLVSMVQGIGVLAASLAVLVVYARGVTGDHTDLTPLLLMRGLLGLVFGSAGGAAAGYLIEPFEVQHSVFFGGAVLSLVGLASALYTAKFRVRSPSPTSFWGWVSLVFPTLLAVGFASNSYTIWEDRILYFLLATLGVLFFASSLRQDKAENRALGCYHSLVFILLTRLSSLSRLCREEQMPYCKSTYYASSTSSTSALWQLAIPFAVALALPEAIKLFYTRTHSYHGLAPFWLGFTFRIGLLLSAIFWGLDAADDADLLPQIPKRSQKGIRVVFSRVTIGLALAVGYTVYAWCKPLLQIRTREARPGDENDSTVVSKDANTALEIRGYANVHGTRYALLLPAWALLLVHVQKPMGAGAMGAMLVQIFCLLEMVAANKLNMPNLPFYPSSSSSSGEEEASWTRPTASAIGPTTLALLALSHFFTTGHSATLPSIQWDTAFLSTHTVSYPLSPLLVTLNTFAPLVLASVAVPALPLWRAPPKRPALLGAVAMAAATFVAVFVGIALASALETAWLRRHLMLYRVFCPRFLTAAGGVAVVCVMVVAGGVVGTWWAFGSVSTVFGW
ncbi:GPI ethanolamine phosphate transferase 3 [Phyllosticta citriasiana]|uniref:GPI ethanolamine phosphate transferase 3 n=1 Tax=Phyllosticta citriasiana TaxID=595635 RepID=A0ABR1KHP5_9PEZI